MSDQQFAELISTIAHELRSPLTSVRGFSAMLLKRWDRFTDQQRLEFIETIMSDAERMGRIISEVLDLARLEAGQLELHLGEVEVETIVQRAMEGLKDKPGGDRVTVDVEAGARAWADPERLERIVAQLIENAMKFSEEGPIDVEVRMDGSDSVTVTVTDSGIGIPADRIPELFESPAPRSGVATPTGTGLGLYITRRLVEAHGGSIDVESKAEGGSTFRVTMPQRKSA